MGGGIDRWGRGQPFRKANFPEERCPTRRIRRELVISKDDIASLLAFTADGYLLCYEATYQQQAAEREEKRNRCRVGWSSRAKLTY